MKYCIAAAVIVLFSLSAAKAQVSWQHKRDSLLAVLAIKKEDSTKVQAMLDIGMHYQANNPDSAMYFFKGLEQLSRKLKYTRGIVTGLNMQAGIYNKQHKLDSAIALDSQALVIAKASGIPRLLGRSYINMANPYRLKGEYNKALDYFLKALAISEQIHDTLSLASLGINMSGLYKNLQEYDNGIASAIRGVQLSKAINNDNLVNSALTVLSSNLIEARRYDTAIIVLNESKKLSTQLNDVQNYIFALINLGSIYSEKDRFADLKANADELMPLAVKMNNQEGIADALEELFAYHFYYKHIAEAKQAAQQELDLAIKNGITVLIGPSYENLGAVELLNGNIPAYKKYEAISDSVKEKLQSDEITKTAQDLEAKYSLDKKQTEINNLTQQQKDQQLIIKQRNTINYVLAGAVLVTLLAGFLYYRNTQHKNRLLTAQDALKQQRIIELEMEKQFLAAESILQGQEEERERLAKDLHDGLGGILSSVKYSFTNMKKNLIITQESAESFDRSMVMLDKSITELRRVAHNMMPEALVNFGLNSALKDFCLGVNQSGALQITYQAFNLEDETVPKNKAAVVYRIVQELVNNTLKHAEAKNMLVQLVITDGALSLTVEDDGRGFDLEKLKTSSGIGYVNLKNRVAYLGGNIDVQASPGTGVAINIEIQDIAGG